MIITSIFLIALGLFMIFKTALIWKITERWTSNDGTEPSNLYLWNTRFGGIMCTLVGLVNLTVHLFFI